MQDFGAWTAKCGAILKEKMLRKNDKPINWTNEFNKLFRKRPYGELKKERYRRIEEENTNIGEQLSQVESIYNGLRAKDKKCHKKVIMAGGYNQEEQKQDGLKIHPKAIRTRSREMRCAFVIAV